MRWTAFLFVLMFMLAGCADEPDEGGDDDMGANGDPSAPLPTDPDPQDNATDEPTFEPYSDSWEGSTAARACAEPTAGGGCADSPTADSDSSHTFTVAEGATKATFTVTWDGGGDLTVDVFGVPTVESHQEVGPSPLEFEVELDEAGDLDVQVAQYQYGSETESNLQAAVEFTVDVTIS